jgi:hypothetical protein
MVCLNPKREEQHCVSTVLLDGKMHVRPGVHTGLCQFGPTVAAWMSVTCMVHGSYVSLLNAIEYLVWCCTNMCMAHAGQGFTNAWVGGPSTSAGTTCRWTPPDVAPCAVFCP